jgi:hypothetical protein
MNSHLEEKKGAIKLKVPKKSNARQSKDEK